MVFPVRHIWHLPHQVLRKVGWATSTPKQAKAQLLPNAQPSSSPTPAPPTPTAQPAALSPSPTPPSAYAAPAATIGAPTTACEASAPPDAAPATTPSCPSVEPSTSSVGTPACVARLDDVDANYDDTNTGVGRVPALRHDQLEGDRGQGATAQQAEALAHHQQHSAAENDLESSERLKVMGQQTVQLETRQSAVVEGEEYDDAKLTESAPGAKEVDRRVHLARGAERRPNDAMEDIDINLQEQSEVLPTDNVNGTPHLEVDSGQGLAVPPEEPPTQHQPQATLGLEFMGVDRQVELESEGRSKDVVEGTFTLQTTVQGAEQHVAAPTWRFYPRSIFVGLLLAALGSGLILWALRRLGPLEQPRMQEGGGAVGDNAP